MSRNGVAVFDAPAKNTRQRKMSEIQSGGLGLGMPNMADNVGALKQGRTNVSTKDKGDVSHKVSDGLFDRSYSEEVLLNPSKQIEKNINSCVNIGANALRENALGVSSDKNRRKSVGELVKTIERKSPVSQEALSRIYKDTQYHTTASSQFTRNMELAGYRHDESSQKWRGTTVKLGYVTAASSQESIVTGDWSTAPEEHWQPQGAWPSTNNQSMEDWSTEVSSSEAEIISGNSERTSENGEDDSLRGSVSDLGNDMGQENEITFKAKRKRKSGKKKKKFAREDSTKAQETEEQHIREEEEEQVIESYKKRLAEGDSSVFFEMFEMLLEKINQVQSRISIIEGNQVNLGADLGTVSTRGESTRSYLKQQIKNSSAINKQLHYVMHVVVRTEQEVEIANRRVEKLEERGNKGSLRIIGLTEKDNENTKEVVLTFFEKIMKMPQIPKVQFAHRLGKGKHRPVLVRLLDRSETQLIFSCVKNLKDVVNPNGKPYIIREQLTEAGNEKKRRQQDIYRQNRSIPLSHQLTLSRKNGEVFIGSDQYKKKVPPPKSKEILSATRPEKDRFHQINISKGGTKEKDGSKYFAYALRTSNFERMRDGYRKIKEQHLGANHIMCGYRIIGENFANLQDYSDDGDHGCARKILEVLQKQGVYNIVVYIVRYYGGVHLGATRFTIVRELTEEILSKLPGALDYGQHHHDQQLIQALQKAVPTSQKTAQEAEQTYMKRGETDAVRGRGGHHRGTSRGATDLEQRQSNN